MQRIAIDSDTRVLVLTGAGISAESGIPTFRDSDGLWETHRFEDVASPVGFRRDPLLVWRFYSQRRAGAAGCAPNRGHRALAALEARLGDHFLLATQNVDGLHRAAGSERVIELHGNLMTSRCSVCDRPPFPDSKAYADGVVPMCGVCAAAGRDALLRPHIVWFGESLDPESLDRVDRFIASALGNRLVFLAVGTSGLVWPAAGMVDEVRRVGGETWLANADPAANGSRFHHVVLGQAGTVLPELLGVADALSG
jgi:NAD-dependent deacetylase